MQSVYFAHLRDIIRTEINAQTETSTKVDNTCHINIVSLFYWVSLLALKQNSYLSVCHSALAIIQAVAEGRRRLRMESKANKSSHVLMFGLSVNLILTLGSLGFTCYSLHRLDSRLTTLERNSLLKSSPYPISNLFLLRQHLLILVQVDHWRKKLLASKELLNEHPCAANVVVFA